MEILAVKYIGMGLCALGMLGAGIGAGIAAYGATQAVARNPQADSKIRLYAILGLAFAEIMGLLSFVLGIMILGGK